MKIVGVIVAAPLLFLIYFLYKFRIFRDDLLSTMTALEDWLGSDWILNTSPNTHPISMPTNDKSAVGDASVN